VPASGAAKYRYFAIDDLPTTYKPGKASDTEYYALDDPSSTDAGYLHTQAIYDASGNAQTTTYSDYVNGKPTVIVGPHGQKTYNHYDTFGNLRWSLNGLGD